MLVITHLDRDKASAQAAKIVAQQVRRKPNLVLGLATGNSPVAMYAELIRMNREEDLDFAEVTSFNLDEYFGISREHPQSFYRYIHENFLEHINIKPENTHI